MVDEVYRCGSGGHGERPAPVESEQHPRLISAGTNGRDYSPSPNVAIRAAASSPGRRRQLHQQHQSAAATTALDPATAASMAASYPSVMQAERILQLRRELVKANEQIVMSGAAGPAVTAAGTFFGNGGRSPGSAGGKRATAAVTAAAAAAWRSHRDDVFLRDLAEKDYHMAGQLGE